MKQVLQSLKDGVTSVAQVPAPGANRGSLLIRSRASLVSAGTERMLLDFGRASWLGKARQQPEKVRQVMEKMRTDGLMATIESVQAKLDQPVALGYSNAGVVLDVGTGVTGFHRGDRVISNGPHAEVVGVPANLCARIPDAVSDDAAAFAVVGAIGLEGVRLIQPQLGEDVVVIGLGLIGILTVQLLRAHGCRVLGIDFDSRKLQLAEAFGAETVNLGLGEDPMVAAERFTRGKGADAALITAATKSNEPVHQAALMLRKRGRIVLVGVTGLELSRDDFYKKELSFQVSCSYGPGRYDPAYEQGGQDYPRAYVRWTAQRNFEAVLDMLADGRLQTERLLTHRFPFDRALEAYELLNRDEFYLGILLDYARGQETLDPGRRRLAVRTAFPGKPTGKPTRKEEVRVGFVGAGGYATKVLIPAFLEAGATLLTVASAGGLSASHAGRKFGFSESTTDTESLLSDQRIDAVVIATRHDSHAGLVCRALEAGKHVFVEKPLALTWEQLDEIEDTYRGLQETRVLMVGFNRRFSPHVRQAQRLLQGMRGTKSLVYMVNAGAIPLEHWTQNAEEGGGRILGEACHFLDLLRFLVGYPARSVRTAQQSVDTATISVSYEDGSVGTVHYFANGHKSFPKERLEIFADGRILVIDNFRKLRGYGGPRFGGSSSWRQDKGAGRMVQAFIDAIRGGGAAPIPFEELREVSRCALLAANPME
ncbi:MAG TPA: bi-domain-containing oxidoreductase [Bryobacteraceae bacterium]|nr:bi-domain-containing oxidoreductase [Bryobacteraceae bacterium]